MNGRNVTKRKKVSVNKKKLWNAFDNAMNKEAPEKKLERLYSLNELGSRQNCELCDHLLFYSVHE